MLSLTRLTLPFLHTCCLSVMDVSPRCFVVCLFTPGLPRLLD